VIILEAVEAVLTQAGVPLYYREITKRSLDQNLWQTTGRTPWETVNARLAVDIKDLGPESRFQRTGKGVFALRAWRLPEYKSPGKANKRKPLTKEPEPPPSRPVEPSLPAPRSLMTFTDAAERVLQGRDSHTPMHYRDITEAALRLGLIHTDGKTPEATLYASLLTEIDRDNRRGQTPRFIKYGRGLVGLSSWHPTGIAGQIEQHNRDVRGLLLARLKSMPPSDFEELIGKLLGELGFQEITRTSYSSDGGIDVRGTLVVGSVVRTTMAVQVKRWRNNVQSPVVQQVRGSLGTHEQGLIITTGGFSKGARVEAAQPNKVPIALMNGEQLVDLLVEHGIGVLRETYHLLSLPLELELSANAVAGLSVTMVARGQLEENDL
jgi:restriction system protein